MLTCEGEYFLITCAHPCLSGSFLVTSTWLSHFWSSEPDLLSVTWCSHHMCILQIQFKPVCDLPQFLVVNLHMFSPPTLTPHQLYVFSVSFLYRKGVPFSIPYKFEFLCYAKGPVCLFECRKGIQGCHCCLSGVHQARGPRCVFFHSILGLGRCSFFLSMAKLFTKYLRSTYHIPGVGLGTEEAVMNKYVLWLYVTFLFSLCLCRGMK